MKTLIVTLALASQLIASVASASGDADSMTIRDFRGRNEQARTYMVLGAIALTGKLEIICPAPISIGEWQAGLMHRSDIDVSRPWIDVLIELMDERGCKGSGVKADT